MTLLLEWMMRNARGPTAADAAIGPKSTIRQYNLKEQYKIR